MFKIKPLNQTHRRSAIRILKSHPEAFGKFEAKRDVVHLLASQMWEIVDKENNFIGMFGLNYFNLGKFEEINLCNVYVLAKHRRKGVFNLMVEFAKQAKINDMKELGKPVYLTICAEPRNTLARNIYSRKFLDAGYNSKQRLYWFEIC